VNLKNLLVLFQVVCTNHQHSDGARSLHIPELLTVRACATLYHGDLARNLPRVFERAVGTQRQAIGKLSLDRLFAV
jgi:hypothetical protein